MARRERTALCDLALVLGEDAPTLCGGWDARDLVTHLLVRERSLTGAAGIAVPGLSGLTDRAMARLGREDFAVLVERLRRPGLTPYALPPLERALNTLEYFVHHEDLRRAQPGWEPRDLDEHDQARLWSLLAVAGRGLVRSAGVPVTIGRSDQGSTRVLRRGEPAVMVTGLPSELVMFLFGRDQVRGLEFSGPIEGIEALKSSTGGV